MSRRHHNNNWQPYAPFHGLLGVGANLQTAPRRDVVTSPLPAVNEGSISTRSSVSSGEYAAGSMDLDDEERARLRLHRRRQKKLDLVVRQSYAAGSQALDDNFTKCHRCNLWINCKDQALHRKGCPTLGTSPVNVSRDSDYRHPITTTPPVTPSGSSSSDPYATRGRPGYPGSSRAPHRSQSVPRTPNIRIPDAQARRDHDHHPLYDASPIISRPAPPYTSTLPPPYTSFIQQPYQPHPPGLPPPSTAIPIYPSGGPHPHRSRPRHQHTHSSQHLSTHGPFAHLENNLYQSRSYGPHF